MSNNLPAVQQLSKDLASQAKAIESMLPPGMDPKRFLRTVINAISTHAQSDALLKADRQSLFSACQKAAGDGLLLDGKEATLVTFKNQATYMPMVQGLVKLARNSGEITTIIAHVVYKDDKFQYRPGIDEQPMHSPDWFAEDRGEPIGVYAVVTTKTGEKICSLMPKKRVLAIGNGGRNGHQYQPGTGAHFEEWWKKTAIKNVLKYAPKSTYLESALDHDNEGYDPDAVQPSYQTPVQKSAADLNAALDGQQAPQGEPDVKTGEVIEHQPHVADDSDPI
jgi:recombination protein RecT